MNDVLKLFDSSEKWTAFRGLANMSEEIMRIWYNELRESLMAYFRIHQNNRWNVVYKGDGIGDIRWYLKEFDEQSACLCMEKVRFSIWLNGSFYDYEKAKLLFQSSNFHPIHSIFRRDMWCYNSYLIAENGNFHFDNELNDRYDYESLAWHAGNKTKEFSQQIIDKVEMITSNDMLTNLVSDLNSQIIKNKI